MESVVFDDMSEPVTPCGPGRGRKRGKKEYPRETAKRLRLSATDKVPSISCQHDSKFCQATQLTTEDLTANHQK